MVPRVTELCRKVLEDEGVAGDVTVSEVNPAVYTNDFQADGLVQIGIRPARGRSTLIRDG
jgi:hypothetical protein